MTNIFLIDGAAGTGKTDMLDYLREKYSPGQVAILGKFTTRQHRPEEIRRGLSLDLTFIPPDKFAELKSNPNFYSYSYGGHDYGFDGEELDERLGKCRNVFIIARDRKTIQEIKDRYTKICVVSVFVYTDREQCEKRLWKDGYSREEIRFRLDRQELTWNDYLRHPSLYSEVIINNSHKNDFHRLIDTLVLKYAPENEPRDLLAISNCEKFPLLQALIGFKDEIRSRLENYDRNVFLMMKFRDKNRLVYEFIKKELGESGFNCVRLGC